MKKAMVFLAILSLLAGAAFLKGDKIKSHYEYKPGGITTINETAGPTGTQKAYDHGSYNSVYNTSWSILDRIVPEKEILIPGSSEPHEIYGTGVKLYSGGSRIDTVAKRVNGRYYKGVSYG